MKRDPFVPTALETIAAADDKVAALRDQKTLGLLLILDLHFNGHSSKIDLDGIRYRPSNNPYPYTDTNLQKIARVFRSSYLAPKAQPERMKIVLERFLERLSAGESELILEVLRGKWEPPFDRSDAQKALPELGLKDTVEPKKDEPPVTTKTETPVTPALGETAPPPTDEDFVKTVFDKNKQKDDTANDVNGPGTNGDPAVEKPVVKSKPASAKPKAATNNRSKRTARPAKRRT